MAESAGYGPHVHSGSNQFGRGIVPELMKVHVPPQAGTHARVPLAAAQAAKPTVPSSWFTVAFVRGLRRSSTWFNSRVLNCSASRALGDALGNRTPDLRITRSRRCVRSIRSRLSGISFGSRSNALDSSAGCQHGCRNHADGTDDLSPDDDPILNPPATCGVHVLVRQARPWG